MPGLPRVPITSSRVSYGAPPTARSSSPGRSTAKKAAAMACVPAHLALLIASYLDVAGRAPSSESASRACAECKAQLCRACAECKA